MLRKRAPQKELLVTHTWGPKAEPALQFSSGLRVRRVERIMQTESPHSFPPPTPTGGHLAGTCSGQA